MEKSPYEVEGGLSPPSKNRREGLKILLKTSVRGEGASV